MAQSGVAFEMRLNAIFKTGETAVVRRLARETEKAKALQAQETSRFGYTLSEAIEHELQSVVVEALAAYDDFIGRPPTRNLKGEISIRGRIPRAVETAVRKASADRHSGPWRALLAREAPAMRRRLVALTDSHFRKLGTDGAAGQRTRTQKSAAKTPVRVALFVTGVALGAVAVHFLISAATS